MYFTKMLIPTLRDDPSDAEAISHQLMIRAGICRKVASGTYTYLPLGQRSLLKIIAIVREEINRAGAQEILVPSLQPLEVQLHWMRRKWSPAVHNRNLRPLCIRLLL